MVKIAGTPTKIFGTPTHIRECCCVSCAQCGGVTIAGISHAVSGFASEGSAINPSFPSVRYRQTGLDAANGTHLFSVDSSCEHDAYKLLGTVSAIRENLVSGSWVEAYKEDWSLYIAATGNISIQSLNSLGPPYGKNTINPAFVPFFLTPFAEITTPFGSGSANFPVPSGGCVWTNQIASTCANTGTVAAGNNFGNPGMWGCSIWSPHFGATIESEFTF